MVTKIFSWLAGLTLVLVFVVAISPDLFRGYVYSEDDRSSGRRVYETYCIGCHGENGMGDGPAAAMLNPMPRNFVNGDYKYFHFGEPPPFPLDESLKITVRNGLPGSAMPAFPLLSDQEINDVVTYIKSLREGGWENTTDSIESVTVVVEVEGTSGEEIFANAGCNGCHQLDAAGAVGGVGPSLNDVGARLSSDGIKASIVNPNEVIAEVCPAGPCPEGVMPQNFGERLTEDQLETLTAYLLEQQ